MNLCRSDERLCKKRRQDYNSGSCSDVLQPTFLSFTSNSSKRTEKYFFDLRNMFLYEEKIRKFSKTKEI